MSYQFEPHLDLTLIISQPEKVIKESTNLSLNINMLLLRPLRNYVFFHVGKTYRFYKVIELIFILYHLPQGRWLIIWMTGKFYWLNGQMTRSMRSLSWMTRKFNNIFDWKICTYRDFFVLFNFCSYVKHNILLPILMNLQMHFVHVTILEMCNLMSD